MRRTKGRTLPGREVDSPRDQLMKVVQILASASTSLASFSKRPTRVNVKANSDGSMMAKARLR